MWRSKDVGSAARRLVEAAKGPKPAEAATVTGAHEAVAGGVPVLVAQAEGAVGGLRKEAQREAEARDRVVLLWNPSGDRKTLVVSVPASLADRLRADEVLKELNIVDPVKYRAAQAELAAMGKTGL